VAHLWGDAGERGSLIVRPLSAAHPMSLCGVMAAQLNISARDTSVSTLKAVVLMMGNFFDS
jgi:hypothetical protein